MAQKTQKSIEILNGQQNHEEIQSRTRDFQPSCFDDYYGQSILKQKLEIYTRAAQQRSEPLDHTLFFGPPGLGKTTLAQIMAHTMGVEILATSGPAIDRTGDLVALLTNLQERDILFIDEIHRMPRAVEEILYNALEKFTVDIIIGQGAGAQAVTLPLKPFTLIGATTKTGMISAPLRSRFGIIERLEFYNPDELAQIVLKNAEFFQIAMERESAQLIAHAARGTPRIAKRLVRRIRDISQIEGAPTITPEIVARAFTILSIDTSGLTAGDQQLLRTLLDRFSGGPVGLETLANILAEDPQTIEDVYEPFLLRQGYLEKTSRGRQIPEKMIGFLTKKFFTETL